MGASERISIRVRRLASRRPSMETTVPTPYDARPNGELYTPL